MERGNDPHQVFESVLATGRTMRATAGENFYASVQKFKITDFVTLFCFQLPCGGSIYVLDVPGERLMIDTGYGIYHHDVMDMFARYGLGDTGRISKIVVTHADADHAGAAGYFPVPSLMHEGTLAIIKKNNRAYRSRSEHSILEGFYTKMINLFSKFNIPENVVCFPGTSGAMRGIFPILGSVVVGRIELEVLESLGGHTYGQLFLYSRDKGLIFAADSVINFTSLTKERADYSSLAAFLVTSVNVDSDLARKERKALIELAEETDRYLAPTGRRCLICGGHGAVSVLKDGKLEIIGEIEQYRA
jgi:glyoxylase-like metal-dependent hydrolase (beta-lactamase superfamily II)